MYLWLSITLIGLLWSEGLGVLGLINSHWYVLSFLWSSIYFIGFIMNGVLISSEWFWAAAVLLASVVAAFLAGPDLYWLPERMDPRHVSSGRIARVAERPPARGARVNELTSNLDDVVLSRPRLSILAALISGNAVDFTFLQKTLGISDGNLSTHLSKLEAERYIRSNKTFVNKKPKTWYQITSDGRRARWNVCSARLEGMLTQGDAGGGTGNPWRPE